MLPVLTKAGCNAGACHGALAGKGGFKLSLRGYDPARDYFAITREARGRRVELTDPGRSLILAKPSGALPHEGGLRLDVGSPSYEIVAKWVAAGAQAPRDDDPRVELIEVVPQRMTLPPWRRLPAADLRQDAAATQIAVRAHYSDSRERDVTPWVKWSSTNEAVARVDDDGSVTVGGSGEGAVVAWYASKLAISRVTVPYDNDVSPERFARFESRNFIDEHVLAQLKRLNLLPSPPADDATFLRRAYLDTIGTILESSSYARSSEPLPENEAETRFYSRYYPRRMMAEVLHDAVVQVTGVPTRFTEIDLRGAERTKTEEYPEGTRAVQLRDAAVASRFLKSFGRNPRNIACECERSNEPSMIQVLHIANGDTINAKLRSVKSCVQEILDKDLPAYRLGPAEQPGILVSALGAA